VAYLVQGDPDYEYQLKLTFFPNGSVSFSDFFFSYRLTYRMYRQPNNNYWRRAVHGIGWIGSLENGSLTGIGKVLVSDGADLEINPSTIVGFINYL